MLLKILINEKTCSGFGQAINIIFDRNNNLYCYDSDHSLSMEGLNKLGIHVCIIDDL